MTKGRVSGPEVLASVGVVVLVALTLVEGRGTDPSAATGLGLESQLMGTADSSGLMNLGCDELLQSCWDDDSKGSHPGNGLLCVECSGGKVLQGWLKVQVVEKERGNGSWDRTRKRTMCISHPSQESVGGNRSRPTRRLLTTSITIPTTSMLQVSKLCFVHYQLPDNIQDQVDLQKIAPLNVEPSGVNSTKKDEKTLGKGDLEAGKANATKAGIETEADTKAETGTKTENQDKHMEPEDLSWQEVISILYFAFIVGFISFRLLFALEAGKSWIIHEHE